MWTALFSGRFREFYVMNVELTGVSSIYDFPIYLVFAIWNIPLWIFEQITGLNALETLPGLLWAKSISIPFLVGIYYFIVKIGRKIKEDFSELLALQMMLTSVMLLVPVLIMGQYDALALLFILIGLFYYIEDDNKKFLLWFAVAVTFKMFALFVFLPLILLKEKKLLRVIEQGICGVSLLVLCKILERFYFVPDPLGSEYVGGHLLSFIFQSQISFVYGGTSLFFAGMVAVCLYCYFKKKPEQEDLGMWAVYVSLLGLAVFFIASLTHPQWSLLLLPFIILLVCCTDEENQKTGLWVDTILSAGMLLGEVIYYYWVFNVKTSVSTVAGKLFYDGVQSYDFSIKDLIATVLPGFDTWQLNLIGGGVFFAGMLYFLYWANPDTDKEKFAKLEIKNSSIINIRLLIIVVTMIMLVSLLFM